VPVNNAVLATLTTEITAGAQTLATLFAAIRAGKYSNYTSVVFTNRGSTTLRFFITELGYSAVNGNSVTLEGGEQLPISSLNTGTVYVLGAGANDLLEFRGEIA